LSPLHLSTLLLTRTQEWECRYLLTKARRLQDAAATLSLSQSSNAIASTTMTRSQPPAYVAFRVEWGKVDVGVRPAPLSLFGWLKWLLFGGWEHQVVKHVVEGWRQVRELMEGRVVSESDEGGVEEGMLKQAVVRHVVEGLRGELVRELVEGLLDA
jgi:hypothetical protein